MSCTLKRILFSVWGKIVNYWLLLVTHTLQYWSRGSEYCLFGAYLKYFPRFEEPRVFLIVESEQEVESDPAVLLLKHEAVSVPGGPRGSHGSAAAALPARIVDQTLLPAAERRRLRRALRLHVRGLCSGLHSVTGADCRCAISAGDRVKYPVIWRSYGDELRKYITCIWLFWACSASWYRLLFRSPK